MKVLSFYCFFLLFGSLVFAQAGDEVYQRVLSEMKAVRNHDDKAERAGLQWPNLHANEGFDALLRIWAALDDEDFETRGACITLMKLSKLPKESRALISAKRVQQAQSPRELNWYMCRMQFEKYDDDMIPFYSQYLDDRRPVVSPANRHMEDVGYVKRLCDGAFNGIKALLVRKNLRTEWEPPFHEFADQLDFTRRDERIVAMVSILEKLEMMYYQQPAGDLITRKTPLDIAAPAESKVAPLQNIDSSAVAASEQSGKWRWPLWALLGLLAAAWGSFRLFGGKKSDVLR